MHRAAFFVRLVAADFAARHLHRYAVVKVNRAAILLCRVAGNHRAGNGNRAARHVYNAAVAARGRVAANRAADKVYRAAAGREDHAALGRFVVGNPAAVHIHGAAFFIPAVQENRAAVLFAVVVCNFAAVQVKGTPAVVQRDGAAPAVACHLAAGNRAAKHIQPALIQVNTAAAPAFGGAFDRPAACAVAKHKPPAVFHLNLVCAVAGKRVAAKAKVQRCAVYYQIAVDGGVLRQIHMRRIVRIADGLGPVPRGIHGAFVRGMVARLNISAAGAVLVDKCPVRIQRVVFAACHRRGFFHLRAAVLFGKPAVKAVVCALWHRQRAVGRALLHGLCLLARCQRAAVGVKRHGGFRNGVHQIQAVIILIHSAFQPAIVRVVADKGLAVCFRNKVSFNQKIIQQNRWAFFCNACKIHADLHLAFCLYPLGKLNLRVFPAQVKVVLRARHRVVIDIRADIAASVRIHAAQIQHVAVQIKARASLRGRVAADFAVPVPYLGVVCRIRAAAVFGAVARNAAAVKLAAPVVLVIHISAIHATAVSRGRVVYNFAAVQLKPCACAGIYAAAVFRLVVRYSAAVQHNLAVFARENAAAVFGAVARNGPARYRKRAAFNIHRAAVAGRMVAGKPAAVQINIRPYGMHAAAAYAARAAAKRARICAVANAQFCRFALVFAFYPDGRLRRVRAGKAVPV